MSKPEKTAKPEKIEKALAKDEIKIKSKDDVKTLLQKAKAEKPLLPQPEKKRRGRPPKKRKPEADLNQYVGNPIAVTMNGFLVHVTNSMLTIAKKGQPLTKEEKLSETDCQIGEALCYTVDYYGIQLAHPIIVIILAFGTFGWQVFAHMSKIKEGQKKKVPE